ncbi:ABC transporter permease [Terriglobus roseus]|uniref:Putative ABC transport system permease protein/macrolide transport system ATP-binding/permease protein n=1 Tax=Terriglobus roseus TaxID=392734 RepID=A0A1H4U5C0_9BACT|nr:ABC transporter permease [Terriglobus roseus]SEC63810.1 putative ABC transport system permease protein/macrolide transport system ATP-binding/permease protein [Terriglobus roseus]
MQTALTVLGLMIGVATVLVMIAVGSGAQRSITGQVRAAGMNVILVSSGNYKMPQQWTSQGEAEEPAAWHPQISKHLRFDDAVYYGRRPLSLSRMQNSPATNPFHDFARGGENAGGLGAATTLTTEDAAAIRELPGVQASSGGMHENGNVSAPGETQKHVLTQIRGEQVWLPSIRRAWIMKQGRFLNEAEDSQAQKVAVLGSVVSNELFADRNPVGEQIDLPGGSFRVIGVIASGSWMVPSSAGDGQFDAVYIPLRTAQQLLGRSNLDTVTVATESTGDVSRLVKTISAELRRRHGLASAAPDDFTVASQARAAIARGGMRTDISRAMMGNANNLDKVTLAQLGKTLDQASRTMSALLAATAAVSLIVGGIGIMNIMLLSVTERTREIGIRRAVGAQADELMEQFLIEAVLLSGGGGLLGIALGLAASIAIARTVQWSVQLSWVAICLSFGISAAIGIVFGYYPARQASRVSPMTSLRYE